MRENVKKPYHILRADQFDRAFLDYLCLLTDNIRRFDKSPQGLLYLKGILAHKRAMLYFTQPSTRTFLSFDSACQIVGVQTSEIRDSAISSERKGESIEDSLRTFSSYVDLIIMRSPIPGLCDRIAELLDNTPRPVPIINAGSGADEHPTQALLDIYTLNRSFRLTGGIDGKTVCMVGDLKRGRTIRSLSRLLTNYKDVKLVFCSPKEYAIEDDLRVFLNKKGVNIRETDEFEDAIKQSDAIYMTRVQDEYDDADSAINQVDVSRFKMKYKHLDILKSDAVIMHPMPRRDELEVAIDQDPRAKYWRQERNGMWTRTALMTMIFGADHHIVLPEI